MPSKTHPNCWRRSLTSLRSLLRVTTLIPGGIAKCMSFVSGFINRKFQGERATPNDPKLSDGGPEAGPVSTAARGEGAGCAGASWRAAQPVTEPVGPKPPPLTETAMPAVRCSAWLGGAGVGTNRRATTGKKRESARSIRVSEDQDRQAVEMGETTEPKKPGLAETVERSGRQSAVLGKDVPL